MSRNVLKDKALRRISGIGCGWISGGESRFGATTSELPKTVRPPFFHWKVELSGVFWCHFPRPLTDSTTVPPVDSARDSGQFIPGGRWIWMCGEEPHWTNFIAC